MTVNGSPVRLSVPTRLTLADALRNELGLTGTHLGCEHGVCGMCTVLVDGDAARSCLLFAGQLDGAEIVTVEGLGAPDDQHPLQESFAHHHALQCGFCTPGFLMSAYDLLAHRPDVPAADLPEQLSGVLCRCTGYRNILTAVEAVARAHPDGIPPPKNCGPQGTIGRKGLATGGLLAGPQGADGDGISSVMEEARAEDEEVVVPHGQPTLVVAVTSELSAPIDDVWSVMNDIDLLARCLPGAELTEHLGEDRYRARARVGLGAVRLSFAGVAEVTERDEDRHLLAVRARGADASAGQTQAEIHLTAEPATGSGSGSGSGSDGAGDGGRRNGGSGDGGGGTRVRADARVWLTGRIAQFGRALAGDVSNRMFEQFAAAVDEAATTGTVSDTNRAVPNPLALTFGAVRERARAMTAELRQRAGGQNRDRDGRPRRQLLGPGPWFRRRR
jgi:carbon-monoxide dehydrogenase small subunit